MAAMQHTSRDGPAPGPGLPRGLTGPGAQLVDMTALDAAVARLDATLRAARPDDGRITDDRDAGRRLAGLCGGLPLALQLSAALLKADPALSPGELADELGVEQERLGSLRYDDGTGPGASSIAAVLELSYRRLAVAAARAFRLLPVNPGPDVSTAAAAALVDLPVSEVRRVLADLIRAHLVEAVPGGGRWRMHDLVRLYAQQLSDAHAEADGREQARDRLLGYYLRMAEAADDYLRVLPGMAVPEEFTGQDGALAWLDAERANLAATVQMSADSGRDEAAVRLPLLLAQYFALRRRFNDLLATTAISLNVARRLGERHHEGDALTNLGGALQEVRRFDEAIIAHQDAVAIYLETGDRTGEGDALNNLGVALKGMRRFSEAITAHQDAAAIYRETSNRTGEGNALNNLGLALKAMGRFNEAITTCQDATAIYRETGDRDGEGDALNNLGVALRESGRSEEAISAFQDAAAIFQETGDRYGQGIALDNLGSALREVGRFEEAVTAHQDAVAIFRETGDRSREGMAHENLERARAAQLA
jgi:tetratricopeptide (TPR) repeat protein